MFQGLLFDCSCSVFTQGESGRELEREEKSNRDITVDLSVSESPQEIVLDGAERPVILSPCSDLTPRYIRVLFEIQSRWTSEFTPGIRIPSQMRLQ